MGLSTWLARRRNENRIKQRSRNRKKTKEVDVDKMIQPHVRRLQRFRNNLMSPQRKQQGKEIVLSKIRGASRGAFIAFGKESRSLFVDESKHPSRRRKRRQRK